MHKRIMQRNNLVIFQINELYQENTTTPRFNVETLDHRVLEQYCLFHDALYFCKATMDFVKSNQRKDKKNDYKSNFQEIP